MNSELVDFLKKYSTIDNKFIEDFFSFYNISSAKPNINVETVAKWLETTKGKN